MQKTIPFDSQETDKIADKEMFADISRILNSGSLVYDVGANQAQFALELLETCEVSIRCFEPVPEDIAFLSELSKKEPRIEPVQLAITDEDQETVEFFVTDSSAGSSLLAPIEGQQSKWLTPKEKIQAKASRLDKYIEANKDERSVDLLKVDAQGADLKVLKSAGTYLTPSHIKAVLVEINFHRFYQKQNRLDEIIGLMEDNGYFVAGIYKHYNRKGWLWWSDFLFLPVNDTYCT